ncbi:MAG: hypothetical protein B0D92_07855, partial [Spirochaeta sp. LUC14_002_19_P3]
RRCSRKPNSWASPIIKQDRTVVYLSTWKRKGCPDKKAKDIFLNQGLTNQFFRGALYQHAGVKRLS